MKKMRDKIIVPNDDETDLQGGLADLFANLLMTGSRSEQDDDKETEED